jgi:tight adherence protein C
VTALALAWAGLIGAWLVVHRPPPLPAVWAAPEVDRPAPRPDLLGILGLAARRERRRRQREVAAVAADLVDLFAVAIGAGLNVRLATTAVAHRGPPGPLSEHLRQVEDDVAAGARLADALDRLPTRLAAAGAPDETVRSLIAALVDAERYGTPLGPTLDRLAAEARRSRQRRAEEVARRVPVKLLFPLVICILPAFGLLTVAPLIAGGLRALRL